MSTLEFKLHLLNTEGRAEVRVKGNRLGELMSGRCLWLKAWSDQQRIEGVNIQPQAFNFYGKAALKGFILCGTVAA